MAEPHQATTTQGQHKVNPPEGKSQKKNVRGTRTKNQTRREYEQCNEFSLRFGFCVALIRALGVSIDLEVLRSQS